MNPLAGGIPGLTDTTNQTTSTSHGGATVGGLTLGGSGVSTTTLLGVGVGALVLGVLIAKVAK